MKKQLMVSVAISILAAFLNIPASLAVSSNPSPVCVGPTCTIDFPFTGDYYRWTVPTTGTYTLEVWGAQGGSAGYNGTLLQAGGAGGYAKGSISLSASTAISIYVGGQGAGLSSSNVVSSLAGGWNGGGAGYNGSTSTTNSRGAGGGGGTDIRVSGTALANRVIVAGGGGGGVLQTESGTNVPGVGGGTSGGNGATSVYPWTNGVNGRGATQSAGGARGFNCGGSVGFISTDGVLGVGGQSDFNDYNGGYGGGGGGGGYYGGGGGGCGVAAGGGSGYVGGVTNTTLTAGNASVPDPAGGTTTGRLGNGFARISYPSGIASISLAVSGGLNRATKGQSITLIATIDSVGKVTFFADGKKIASCVALQASVGSKSCAWKPNIQKSVFISARIDPASGISAWSNAVSVSVAKRTGLR